MLVSTGAEAFDLSHVSAAEVLTMDYKNFKFAGKKVGIGVAETLTDTKHKKASLLWIDNVDGKVADTAFEGKATDGWLVLDGVTSRKRQIGPAIQKAVESLN